jgi:hypothetical protein
MSTLSALVNQTEYKLKRFHKLSESKRELSAAIDHYTALHADLIEAQRLLSTISEENTVRTLDYITGVINNALAEIFQGEGRQVSLDKELYRGRYAHIKVHLTTSTGAQRNLDLQTGSGVKEVISFLFTVCLIAVRGGRRFLIMDELLSGLHADAKAVIAELMGVFTEEGFQFLMVEYGLDNHKGHSFGKIYNVESDNSAVPVSIVREVPDGGYQPVRYQ